MFVYELVLVRAQRQKRVPSYRQQIISGLTFTTATRSSQQVQHETHTYTHGCATCKTLKTRGRFTVGSLSDGVCNRAFVRCVYIYAQRYRRRLSVLRRFHAARLEPPLLLLNRWPLKPPRFIRPAEVSPRSSRCLCTGLTIQLMRGSLRMTLWLGSTRITSKNLYVESWKESAKAEGGSVPAVSFPRARGY